MGKLNTLHVKNQVVEMLTVGETHTNIAKQIGVERSTISKFSSKDEVRELIEQEQMKLAEVLPDAVQNVKDLVEEMKEIPKDDIKRRELSYKATKDTLKATGLFPSPQFANNIFNDNRQQNAYTSPDFIEMCRNHIDEVMGVSGSDTSGDNQIEDGI
ncbi:Helix-turn-helix protein, YlxM/p13 domain protein [Candidatus Scalindua japonica]|uniref:Helix-turn-helix protein, YlxM/p13 domain protein n=1 Tax=Candidatus Scalindua japonica TaxID=1284222 RepID=A0A286TVM9_9BACT|nr:hypothetical protein [Candidatus Scalindua japonica]GAX59905.1 Helix-turn-helix protein, YlxM/p13 domain protein [Candidatus Scalindua japonica]